MPVQTISVTETHNVVIYVCDNPTCTFGVSGAPSQYRFDNGSTPFTPFVHFDLRIPDLVAGVETLIHGESCQNGPTKLFCTKQAIAAQLAGR